MPGVALPSPRTSYPGLCLAAMVTAVSCVPLSNLDDAAQGSGGTATGGASEVPGGTSGANSTAASSGGVNDPAGGVAGAGGAAAAAGGGATAGVPAGGVSNGGAGGAGPDGGEGQGGAAGRSRGGAAGRSGAAGEGGATDSGGTGGSVECGEPMADCDDDPTDCETDTSSDPAHCGACDSPCPGEHDECVQSECVTPCTEETAFVMSDYNIIYQVPGDGCVMIADHLAGNYYIQVNRELSFTYFDECGNTGGGDLHAGLQSEPIPACVMVIDLLGTSPPVEIIWWYGG